MKSIKTLLICLSSFILLCILSSCEDEHELNYESFLIMVDSIQMSDKITINDSFSIKFYGTIGTNGCYQFLQFKTEEQEKNIIIEAWGKIDKNSNICPTVMVYLDNEKLNYLIKEKGIYTIKVKQPDDTYLEKQILVE